MARKIFSYRTLAFSRVTLLHHVTNTWEILAFLIFVRSQWPLTMKSWLVPLSTEQKESFARCLKTSKHFNFFWTAFCRTEIKLNLNIFWNIWCFWVQVLHRELKLAAVGFTISLEIQRSSLWNLWLFWWTQMCSRPLKISMTSTEAWVKIWKY